MKSDIDWLPYFGPMLGFALVLTAADYLPGASPLLLLVLRAAVPLGLFLYFYLRGSYPELHDFKPGAAAGLDVLVGLGVAALWMAPYVLGWLERPGGEESFDAGIAGPELEPLVLGLRLVGFAAVTPFIEELLVRSFLMRVTDVIDTDRDFRELPIGQFAWRSFAVTLVWFTFTHAQWEWPVAFLTGVVYNLWLYRRRHIGALILTHAATNAALFGAVVWAAGRGRDWWFFL